jgi:hypothetical protein
VGRMCTHILPAPPSLPQANYGFSCTCPRCSLEASLPPEAHDLLSDLADAGQLVQQVSE